MRILYDGFIFAAQAGGGISRYFDSLIRRLPSDWEPVMWYGNEPETLRPSHNRLREHRFRMDRIRPPGLGRLLGRHYFRALEKLSSYDLAHPTFHLKLPADRIKRSRRPLVVTIHDMIPEIFARDLDPDGSDAEAKREVIQAADAILCVSQNTKRDLQQRYAIPDSRITITYLASDLRAEMGMGPEPVPNNPYLLFMGNRGIYKNFARVLLAFSRASVEWTDLHLCVVGSAFNPTEVDYIRALRIEHRIRHLGYLADNHLAKLYRCSRALVYPSLYEGFGIPPLEAMACGTVVITSHRASIPEVVGDAAVVVDPESIDELVDAMLSVREDGSVRENLIAKGTQRAQQFSWDETARKTAAVYRAVVDKP